MKTNFHNKNFALRTGLQRKQAWSRKWPVFLNFAMSFVLSCQLLRGTQRICSSHYLFPRGILLAGKNTGVSMSWLGNFVIDRGFASELLTFSSISTRAGCRNSEDWGRLKKKKKRTLSLSQRVVTNIRRLVRVIALAEKICFVSVLSLLFGRFGSRNLKARGIPGWETNQFYLAGWEISCVSCWDKGTDNVFPTPENALITFIFINWGIIIHFTTNWSWGAPDYSPAIKMGITEFLFEIYAFKNNI